MNTANIGIGKKSEGWIVYITYSAGMGQIWGYWPSENSPFESYEEALEEAKRLAKSFRLSENSIRGRRGDKGG